MLKVEELVALLDKYEEYEKCDVWKEAVKRDKLFNVYYAYKKQLSERVSPIFNMGNLITEIAFCPTIDKSDRLQVLIKVLNAMNIGVE